MRVVCLRFEKVALFYPSAFCIYIIIHNKSFLQNGTNISGLAKWTQQKIAFSAEWALPSSQVDYSIELRTLDSKGIFSLDASQSNDLSCSICGTTMRAKKCILKLTLVLLVESGGWSNEVVAVFQLLLRTLQCLCAIATLMLQSWCTK